MERTTEDMKLWLFDLAHGNIADDKEVLSGFVRSYVLHGLTMANVIDDIHFRTNYGLDGVVKASDTLKRVLCNVAGIEVVS